jgi:hypothetical protein
LENCLGSPAIDEEEDAQWDRKKSEEQTLTLGRVKQSGEIGMRGSAVAGETIDMHRFVSLDFFSLSLTCFFFSTTEVTSEIDGCGQKNWVSYLGKKIESKTWSGWVWETIGYKGAR